MIYNPPAVAPPTREFWIPTTAAPPEFYNQWAVRNCQAADIAYICFRVPHDFTAIVSAEVVIIPQFTNAVFALNIRSIYAAVGEAQNTHVEQDLAGTFDLTIDVLAAIDISGILTALAADDEVGIAIERRVAGDNFYTLGIRFRYS